MEFNGFYNFAGGGTETILGVANDNLPSFTENVCANEKMLFTGQFSNLSRQLIHITFHGFGSAQAFHRHDLRAYESIQVYNVPIASVALHVPAGETIGIHGMGTIWTAQDEDEYAIMGAKSGMFEALPNSPNFNTDSYTRVTQAAAATVDLVVSGANDDFAAYKITVSPVAAQIVDLFWTDSVNGNINFIGNLNFAGAGTFVYDFPDSMMRNPARQGGKLRMTTSTAASTVVDVVGHIVLVGQ
tara:strand:+ start:2510 stop:3238 length:729 start_codon:yes stop_codon:yes gene_type:complete